MPGFDQKGPMGQGAMTGRRMGRCTNFAAKAKEQSNLGTVKPQENSPENFTATGRGLVRGRGLGCMMGKGFGMGWRRGSGKGMQNRFRGGF